MDLTSLEGVAHTGRPVAASGRRAASTSGIVGKLAAAAALALTYFIERVNQQ